MPSNLIISVDAMGGDAAPQIVVDGIAHFLAHQGEGRGLHFNLHGDEAKIRPLLVQAGLTEEQCGVSHTDKVIEMGAKISQALRRGKGTSMWNAIADVKSGDAHVGVSAGNTGALMAMSKLQLRMKAGVQRPAIAALWPQKKGMCVVLDAGANIGCDAAQLTEFAVLGEAYYRALYNVDKPKIGLLNNGTEELKGNDIIRAAHERLAESELGLNYVGYVEGNDISMGDADVIVTDGFTGNVALKTAEGTAKLIHHFLQEVFTENLLSKLAALVAYPVLKRLSKKIDPRMLNGGVFLGLNGLMIKSHGGTDALGFANALNIAADLAQSSFMDEIDRTLLALHDEDENIGFIV